MKYKTEPIGTAECISHHPCTACCIPGDLLAVVITSAGMIRCFLAARVFRPVDIYSKGAVMEW